MKKISSLIGIGLLGAVFMSFTAAQEGEPKAENLKVEDITVIEIEEEIDLGFNTAQYLPEGFNPYKGIILNLDDIVIIEDEQEIDLGFDTAQYLPVGFNACKGTQSKICNIDFLEVESEIILEFNEEDYLPENFNPLSK